MLIAFPHSQSLRCEGYTICQLNVDQYIVSHVCVLVMYPWVYILIAHYLLGSIYPHRHTTDCITEVMTGPIRPEQ